jgi:hypothetical protein
MGFLDFVELYDLNAVDWLKAVEEKCSGDVVDVEDGDENDCRRGIFL